MKQAIQNLKTGEVRVEEVPPPLLRAPGALVSTLASLISAGTERSKIEMGEKNMLAKARARPDLARQVVQKAREDGIRETYQTVMHRLEAPSSLGYSSAGRVIDASGCSDISAGDLVACAGAGYANHAEVVYVPRNLMAKVPEGVSPGQAAYATVGAIAMQGVRQAEVRLGDRVVVIGLGLIGLLAVQIARAAGGRVLGIDLDPAACELARRAGAEVAVPRGEAVAAVVGSFTDGAGADSVLICASSTSNDPIELAGELARDRGRVVVVGAVRMDLPRPAFYDKELELRLARSYGPGRYDPSYEERGHDYPIGYVRWTEQRQLAEFLRLLATGAVDVDLLTSHRFPIDAVPDAYALISGKRPEEGRAIGVLLEYAGSDSPGPSRIDVLPPAPARRGRDGLIGVAAIGAGNFATRVLLPAISADGGVRLTGIATAGGASARHAAERFGFEYATSDTDQLLADEAVDAVLIATRHDSHADLATRAIGAGKAVFCEKPLATTWDGLEQVAAAWAERPVPLLVGFNRRFSPLVDDMRASLPPGTPRVILCRVNAGPLPSDHWTKDPVAGGGRIVGELCHFLDLACALAEGTPTRVSCELLAEGDGAAPSDSAVVQVAFACGSVASLQYLGNGDPSVPKERIEVFCGGTVAAIDDFRSLEVVRGGKSRERSSRPQLKGHAEEMSLFVTLASGAREPIGPATTAMWSSALTLQVPLAASLGRAVSVDLPEALGGRGRKAADAA